MLINESTLVSRLDKGIWHQAQDTEFDTGFNEAKKQALELAQQFICEQRQVMKDLLKHAAGKAANGWGDSTGFEQAFKDIGKVYQLPTKGSGHE